MNQNIFNLFKDFLSRKSVSLVIIIFAVTSRIIQLVYFFNIGLDVSYQVAATKNFVEGNGISLDKVSATNLSDTIYTPLIRWPPGFSIILSPFYILTGKNYLIAGLALSIIAGLVLIFVSRGILKLLGLPVYLINLYTLVAGFFIYYFYFIASTDAVMISLFFIALYYTISFLNNTNGWRWKTTILTICLFACASIKYLFIPAAFVIPAFLILKGYGDKNWLWKKAGIYSFSFLILLIGILLGYQYYINNSVGYISSTGRGFFPSHLLDFYPFVPGSVIRTESIGLLLKNPSFETALSKIFQVLHFVFLLGASVLILRRIFKYGFKNLDPVTSFFYIGFFIAIAITFLLAVLSLLVSKELWESGYLWTYVEDQRYYGTLNVYTHLVLFIGWWHFKPIKKRFITYSFYLLFLLCFIEIARGFNFDINRIKNFKKEEYSWQSEYKLQQYADSILIKERLKNPGNKLIIGGSHQFINIWVCIHSHVPVLEDISAINNLASLRTKENITMLIILQNKYLQYFQPFLASNEKELAGYLYDNNFYIVYVKPH